MQTLLMGVLILATMEVLPGPEYSCAQESDAEQSLAETRLRKSIADFSESMTETGFGWEGHAAFLHKDFTRSYNGGATIERAEHIDGIQQWWDAGNRVHKSERDIKHLRISDDVAVVRIDIVEHHIDPTGVISRAFDGHVAQVWVRSDEDWELLSNEVISRRD